MRKNLIFRIAVDEVSLTVYEYFSELYMSNAILFTIELILHIREQNVTFAADFCLSVLGGDEHAVAAFELKNIVAHSERCRAVGNNN